jgi:branched-chain amino acid transport system permease protein
MNRKRTSLLLLGIFLVILPMIIRNEVYFIHMLNMVGIYSLLAIGLNLVLGYCGQFSVGQAGFFAIGAYTSALLSVEANFSFWLALPISGIAAGLAGLIVGPVLRLRGIFLGMSTLAFGEITRLIITNWVSLTNGPNGIMDIPPPQIGPFSFSTETSFYYLILVIVVINYIVGLRMVNSRFGRAMKAIRDNPDAAEVMGVWAARYKIETWIVAAFFAGIAGSLAAHLNAYISPDEFTFWTSVNLIFMLIVGGMGTLGGSIVGAFVIVCLPEFFRVFAEYRMIIYPFAVILILIFVPEGLYGLIKRAVEIAGKAFSSAQFSVRRKEIQNS